MCEDNTASHHDKHFSEGVAPDLLVRYWSHTVMPNSGYISWVLAPYIKRYAAIVSFT